MRYRFAVLILLALLQCPAWAIPTAAQLESTINDIEVLKGKKFKAGISDKEVQIATYSSTGLDNDLKIETVLVGRTIVDKYPDVARVVVNYYSDKSTTTYKQVVVTKPEIVAFGAGKVTDGELLSAIRIEEKTDAAAAAAAEKKQTRKD